MNSDTIKRVEFDRLIRDLLSNLFDYAALETHPMASVFLKPSDYDGSRAEYLRQLLQDTIEKLRPKDRELSLGAVEWRPYLILHGRYIECVSLQVLQTRLSLSERQLRREHSRAVQAVAAILWDETSLWNEASFWNEASSTRVDSQGLAEDESASPVQWVKNFHAFQITRAPLDIAKLVHGVAETLHQRVDCEGTELLLALSEELPAVLADRVVLRLILLGLINHALDERSGGHITIGTRVEADRVTLWVGFQTDALSSSLPDDEEAPLEALHYWAQRLGAPLEEIRNVEAHTIRTRLSLSLSRATQLVVLVVDDQKASINMYRRYLSRSNVQVIGIQEPEQALTLARQLQPQAITLDVMMPTMDGWEVLQTLQADPETRHIPVIVCSVWDEPELAFSLGAAGFLKKPITQHSLLDALARLKLLDMPA